MPAPIPLDQILDAPAPQYDQLSAALTPPVAPPVADMTPRAIPGNLALNLPDAATAPAVRPIQVGYADGATTTPTAQERQAFRDTAARVQQAPRPGVGPVDPATLAFAQPVGDPNGAAQAAPPPRPQMVGASNQSLIAPEYQKAEQAAFGAQQNAIGAQQQAQTQLGRDEASSLQQQATGERDQATQLRNGAQDSKADYVLRAQKADDQLAKVNDIAAKVAKDYALSPADVWHSTSTLDKIRFGLADALGGFVQGFNHLAKNPIDAVQKHIQGEIDTARENYERGSKNLGEQKGIYADLMKRAGSPEDADKAYHAILSDAAAHEAKAMAIESGSQVAIGKADLIGQQLEERKAQVGREATEAEIKDHKYVPAHLAGPAVNPALAVDWRDQNKHSAEEQKAFLPALTAEVGALDSLPRDADGNLAGTGWLSRAAKAVLPQGVSDWARGHDARVVDRALTKVGATEAHANGHRSTEAIKEFRDQRFGNGSQEDINSGIAGLKQAIATTQAAIDAGHPGLQNQFHELNRKLSLAQNPSAGAGVADTPAGFSDGEEDDDK